MTARVWKWIFLDGPVKPGHDELIYALACRNHRSKLNRNILVYAGMRVTRPTYGSESPPAG